MYCYTGQSKYLKCQQSFSEEGQVAYTPLISAFALVSNLYVFFWVRRGS